MQLNLKLQLFKRKLFLKKEKAEQKAKSEEYFDEKPQDQSYLTNVNNLLHSLFSNCEVYFNNTNVYSANRLYLRRAKISNEFNSRNTLTRNLNINLT